MASINLTIIFLIRCNYCPSSTNFYSVSLILLITHSGSTFLLHILLFNSINITFCIHLPCSIYHFIWLTAIKITPWSSKLKEVINNHWTQREDKPPSEETFKGRVERLLKFVQLSCQFTSWIFLCWKNHCKNFFSPSPASSWVTAIRCSKLFGFRTGLDTKNMGRSVLC